MPKDRIFKAQKKLIENFNFGKQTTAVFDDMLRRSVPFYDEMQRMIKEMTAEFAVEGTNVYDLGCSTGNTFLPLDRVQGPIAWEVRAIATVDGVPRLVTLLISDAARAVTWTSLDGPAPAPS